MRKALGVCARQQSVCKGPLQKAKCPTKLVFVFVFILIERHVRGVARCRGAFAVCAAALLFAVYLLVLLSARKSAPMAAPAIRSFRSSVARAGCRCACVGKRGKALLLHAAFFVGARKSAAYMFNRTNAQTRRAVARAQSYRLHNTGAAKQN